MKKAILICALAALTATVARAVGESFAAADGWSSGDVKSVTLVSGTDDFGQSIGVYYVKMVALENKPCTVWTTGSKAVELTAYDSSQAQTWAFAGSSEPDNINYRIWMSADDWSWHDGEVINGKATFYLKLEGSAGQTVTLHHSNSVIEPKRPAAEKGSEQAPESITFGEKEKTAKRTLLGVNAYYFSASLKAGTSYKVGVTNLANAAIEVTTSTGRKVTLEKLDGWCGVKAIGYLFTPDVAGSYRICVSAKSPGSFTLRYQMVAARTPEEHHPTVLAEPTDDAPVVSAADCRPGHRNDPESGFRDDVIDEQLYKVSLRKGKTYAFATSGAATNLVMELYDKDGKRLAVNRVGSKTGPDCLIAYRPSADGAVYVGVCQDLADDLHDKPAYGPLTLSVSLVTDAKTDIWDPDDDDVSAVPSASYLLPALGSLSDDVIQKGSAHGPHVLGLTDWTDCYGLACRKGVTYRLQAETDDADCARLWMLTCSVYTVSTDAKGKTQLKFQQGGDLLKGVSIAAKANETCFLEVSVRGAQGVTFPYTLHALACDSSGGDLGQLQVFIEGARSATWSLACDGKNPPAYQSGACVILPVSGNNRVVFSTASGRNKPEDIADPGLVANEIVKLTSRYSDTNDALEDNYRLDATKGDGAPNAAKVTVLKPAAEKNGKGASVSRTLWPGDLADWYRFSASPSTYYVFRVAEKAGADLVTLELYADSAMTTLLACGTDIAYLCREKKSATCYLRVIHSDGSTGGEYELEYFSRAIGTVGFAKAAQTVKDNVATVTLSVKRTGGKAGVARVRYATEGVTAVAGEDYEPQTGILEWADGDTKEKKVTVKLIPELVSHWAESREFAVTLSPLKPYPEEMAEGELAPALGVARTVVTIADASKKAPGTVQFCGWGYGNDPFANAKKPAAEVAAGDNLRLWLSRTGGSDGKVTVTVTPTKGKAVAGKDFDGSAETIVWEPGDDEPKSFDLTTFRTSDSYAAAKSMTVKLAVDKKNGEAAKTGSSSVAVSLVSPELSRTVESYAGSLPKAAGIAVKAAKADTWYFDASSLLRSVTPAAGGKAELTVTLTGPGRLSFTPYFDMEDEKDPSTFKCKNGKKAVELSFGEENVLYLPKGKTTLSFTLARDKKSSADVIASFADAGGGEPFAWKPLPLSACVSPMPGEVAATVTPCPKSPTNGEDEEEDEEAIRFLWSDARDEEIAYLFTLDENKKNLGKASARVSPRLCPTGETEVAVICSDCGEVKVVPPNKIATGRTYYWRVDSVLLKDGQPVLTNVNTAVWTVNPMKCAGLPQPVIASGTDADGNDISALEKEGSAYPVKLVQGVAADLQLAGTNVFPYATKVEFRLASGSAKLPAGLSISNGRITGTPTKLGTTVCAVGIRVTYPNSAKPGKSIVTDYSTIAFKFTVVSPELAAGTFNGLVSTEDERIAGSASRFGQTFGSLKVTASADGKISASVSLGGSTYKFSGKKGYGACVPCLDNGLPGVTVTLSNAVTLTTVNGTTKVKNKCFDTLTLTTTRADASDWTALDSAMAAELSVNMLSEDKKSVLRDIRWSGEARRDNIKVASVAEGLSGFLGYYTVSLNPTNEVKGVTGSGYLGVTLDKKGVAKVTGVLADGSKVSVSATASYVSTFADGCERLLVPVYGWIGKKQAFGGWLTIAFGEDGVARVASEGRALRWLNTDKAKSADGKAGYKLVVEPIGGYYNTVYNLQRYYLDEEFRVKGLDLEEIPAEFFGTKIPTVYPGSFDAILDWQINSLKLASNPANIKFTFKRATGIWTGTFDIFVEGQSKKFGGKSYSHQGVLVMYRDPLATIGEDVPMMGFYQLPIKSGGRSWTASLPFDVVADPRVAGWDQE